MNGILAASGSSATPCEIWKLEEPALFRPLQALDRLRFRRGEPHLLGVSRRAA